MKRLLLLLFILAAQTAYPQWEKTSWRNEPTIKDFWVQDSIIILHINDELKISTNYGKTFPIVSKLPNKFHPGKIFIIGKSIYIKSYEKIAISMDFGENWICSPSFKLDSLLQDEFYAEYGNDIFSILPIKDKIYATTRLGFFVTSDLGHNWKLVSEDFSYKLEYSDLYSFDGKSFLIINNLTNPRELFLYEYNNKVERWEKQKDFNLKVGEERYCSELYINKDTIIIRADTAIHRGGLYNPPKVLYISRDRGKSWDTVIADMDEGYFVTSSVVGDHILLKSPKYGYTTYGYANCYYTTNLGNDWITVKENDWPVSLYKFARKFLTANNKFYASSRSELWVSEDTLQTWKPILRNKSYPEILNIIAHRNDLYVLAGYSNDHLTYNHSIYKSSDGGQTWSSCGVDFNPERMYPANFSVGDGRIFVGNSYQLVTSTDEGKNWIVEKNARSSFKRMLLNEFEIQWAAPDGPLINRIDKYGSTKELSINNFKVYNRLFPYTSDGKIYIPSDSCFYVSNDYGISWNEYRLIPPLRYINNNYCIADSGILFNANDPDFIYISTDSGLHWNNRTEGMDIYKTLTVESITTLGDYVYCGVYDQDDHNNTCIYRAKISDFLKRR